MLAAVRHDKSSPLSVGQEKTQSDVQGQVNPSQASGDPLHFRGVGSPRDLPHKVPQSDDPSQENPCQASDDRLHIPSFATNVRVTEEEASDVEGCCWMPKREQHNSSSSRRNESHNPNVQASGEQLQSCWMPKREQHNSSSYRWNESHNPKVQASGDRLESKKKDDMTNMLSPGVKLFLPNLATRVEENLKNTFWKIEFDKFPGQHHCNMVFFRTRLHVGIIPNDQIRRYLHQGLSALFLVEYAGHTEPPDWQHS